MKQGKDSDPWDQIILDRADLDLEHWQAQDFLERVLNIIQLHLSPGELLSLAFDKYITINIYKFKVLGIE